jgi:hypothetical protein
MWIKTTLIVLIAIPLLVLLYVLLIDILKDYFKNKKRGY